MHNSRKSGTGTTFFGAGELANKDGGGIIARVFAMKDVPDEMPTKEVEIYSIENLGTREMIGAEVLNQVKEKISLVKGDFRQEEIIAKWEGVFDENLLKKKFTLSKIRVKCSSGTYMRSLASRMGKDVGVGAVAFSILRTKILSGEGSSIL